MHPVARVRSFNRTVTQTIGVLRGNYLGRGRSLGASRLLFEIGKRGAEVRDLRARLELDSGYASRLLRGLEAEGLVRTTKAASDARARVARLTAAGRRELALLNRLSDEGARGLLDSLGETQRGRLVEAMATVERLLEAATIHFDISDFDSPAVQYCLSRYFEEIARRFEGGFDHARVLQVTSEDVTPPRGFFVVATLKGEPIGCGALKCHDGFGEIKRMWIAPSARGLGLGRRLLQRLEELARKRRLRLVRLETNKALTEAQALYRSSGYREVKPFNDEPHAHFWFERRL